MILIKTNQNCANEKRYVFEVVFTEFFGIDFQLSFDNSVKDTLLTVENSSGPHLAIDDRFFWNCESSWLDKKTLPNLPLPIFDIKKSEVELRLPFSTISVLYGDPHVTLEISGNISCGLDLFGGIFFMLSRYEEMVSSERDKHDRFPASSSIAYLAGFLHRPIVNEYIEILWQLLIQLNPGLKRKSRTFKITLTCDVDRPYNPVNRSYKLLAKTLGKAILRDFSIKNAAKCAREFIKTRISGWDHDSFNTFDYLMDVADQNNINAVFYFICDQSSEIDGDYALDDPNIVDLLMRIHGRGHEIGIHASYNTYLNIQQTQKEINLLKAKLRALGIVQSSLGNRQHYLRYQTPTTIYNLNEVGISYDTTLSYADLVGFRCGVCYEYPMYDIKNRVELSIKERPLIAMEATVISNNYMGLSYSDKALKVFLDLKEQCRLYNGDYVLLWHNSSFQDPRAFKMLESIVRMPPS